MASEKFREMVCPSALIAGLLTLGASVSVLTPVGALVRPPLYVKLSLKLSSQSPLVEEIALSLPSYLR